MLKNLSQYLDKTIKVILKGTIFLLPLFFLPWTSEYFEFSKQLLLWLAMPSALLLWFLAQAIRGEIKIKTNPLNLPIIIFLVLTLLSAVFSLNVFSSFFGSYGRFSDAWLGLLSLVIFYWLSINTDLANTAEKIFSLLKLFFYSAFAVVFISLLAMFGLTRIFTAGPFNLLASSSFNPAGGSLLNLAVFFAVMLVMTAGFLFFKTIKKKDYIIFSLGSALFLAALFLINFYLSWIILIIGAVCIIIFSFFEVRLNFKKNYFLLIPAALILVGVLMLSLVELKPAKIILGDNLPREISLNYRTSALIAKKALLAKPILGSGPGTFSHNFSLYRPAEFNQKDYWQIRFNKSSSYFLDILATEGLPALISYLLIISLIIYINIILLIRYFKKRQSEIERETYSLITIIFTSFILLFIIQLFFQIDTVLNFSVWFFMALAVAFWQNINQSIFKEKIINLNKTILFFRLLLLSLFLFFILWLTLLVFEIKFFTAELAAVSAFNREVGLVKAVKLNSNRASYSINLAKIYLNYARLEAAKDGKEKDNNFIQANISKSIEAGRLAAATDPYSVKAQETLGMIYRDIRLLTIGSELWAEQFFNNALTLEPTNPILTAELAKIYLNSNDIVNAEKYFIKALELKPNYYEAKFGLVKVYLKNKKDNQALNLLNELATEVYDEEIFYELGRFYFNHGEIDKAIDRFKLILSLTPGHSNSLYSLGIAYEAKGDFKEALRYYGKVLELNQDNEEVKNKIEDLSNKK